MSCQSAPGCTTLQWVLNTGVPRFTNLMHSEVGGPMRNPGTFFIGFFDFGKGHRGPMIPYCLGAP
ncbi:unnamed protein product, partial [Staurois parvus]